MLWQLGTAAVTAGLLVRGLLGVVWAIPAAGHVPAGFYWTNLLAYTPLCLGMAVAGLWLLRPAPKPTRWRRLATAQMLAGTLPVALVAGLLLGGYGRLPMEADGRPDQPLGAISSRYVDTELARLHYLGDGHGPDV